jgi:UDP-2,3-diacylglucosamine hydrolase
MIMKIAAISDVHVKSPNDEADKLLSSFFLHPEVQSSDYILLLGDIFDLMCGPHEEYLLLYKHHFDAMTELQKKGKKVFFFEGNHDLHLEKLFKKIWKNQEVIVSQLPIFCEIAGKSYYFSHGDEHEIDNISYHRYINIIRSRPLKFIADYIMPFKVLNFFGERASKMSRKKGSKRFDAEGVRRRFRLGVSETTQGKFDFVLGGHSHVKDEYIIPGSQSLYLNNGYALNSRTFIMVDNHKANFLPLI